MPSSAYKNIIKFSLLDVIIETESEAINIPKFLTKNVVTSIIQVLSRVESTTEEESVILALLERLVARAKDNQEMLRPVLKLLLQEHGKITFDKITGKQ